MNDDSSQKPSTDTLSKEKRSRLMGNVRHKDTKPELAVQDQLRRMGIQFHLNVNDLPGTPDIVLPEHQTAIFVHGCFWHRHSNCRKATTPKQNFDFWNKKFERNVERDAEKVQALEAQGWRVFTIWQCETEKMKNLSSRLSELLKDVLLKASETD